jgi:lipoprotein NlpI
LNSQAIENYRQVLSIDSGMPAAYIGLGISLATSGDVSGAIRQFKAALALDPTNKDAAQDLAQAEALSNHSISP